MEICVDNPQSLRAAVSGGADRIELCSALALGGLTPTDSFMHLAARSGVATYAMIRPRDGDFNFTPEEIDLMADDIQRCAAAGLAGVVIGAARDRALDVTTMARLTDAAGPLGVALHRVFDLLEDPLRSIDLAAELGIERILTSGGGRTAEAGIDELKRFVSHAAGRLSIMAGSGIHAGNAVEIVQQTGVREIHGSFSKRTRSYDPSVQKFGFSVADDLMSTNSSTVRKTKQALDRL
jgi:copper homeostasis protein